MAVRFIFKAPFTSICLFLTPISARLLYFVHERPQNNVTARQKRRLHCVISVSGGSMHLRLAIVVAGLLAVPSLSLAQKVNFDYDHGANFSMYHTYRLLRIGDNPAISQLYDQ